MPLACGRICELHPVRDVCQRRLWGAAGLEVVRLRQRERQGILADCLGLLQCTPQAH